jgi:hypothetical protein
MVKGVMCLEILSLFKLGFGLYTKLVLHFQYFYWFVASGDGGNFKQKHEFEQ